MPRRNRKDGHSTVSKSMAEGRHKGKDHGKISLGRNYWKLLIRYGQKLCMDVPRCRSFDHTDKKWPFRTMLSRPYNNPNFANVGGGAGPSLLLPPPLSLIDQN